MRYSAPFLSSAGGEICVMRRVRIDLSFEAEAPTAVIGRAVFALRAARPCRCRNRTAPRAGSSRSRGRCPVSRDSATAARPERAVRAVYGVVVVEAAAEAQGFKVQVRPLAYDDRLAQVHGRPRHVRYLARRDEARVRGRVVRGVYLYELLLHRAAVVAGEVEICVVVRLQSVSASEKAR